MARSRVEMLGLRYEAERLVRAGVSRAQVSQMLGVHSQTLAQWALAEKWRKKDIDLEGSGWTAKRTIRNIAMAHAQRRLARETLEAQAKVMKQAIHLLADKGPEAAKELRRLIASVKQMPRLEAPETELVPQGRRSIGEYRGARKRKRDRQG